MVDAFSVNHNGNRTLVNRIVVNVYSGVQDVYD
jgi:hypothetical protein